MPLPNDTHECQQENGTTQDRTFGDTDSHELLPFINSIAELARCKSPVRKRDSIIRQYAKCFLLSEVQGEATASHTVGGGAFAMKSSALRSRLHRSTIAEFETSAIIHNRSDTHCERSEPPAPDSHAGWCGRGLGVIRVPIPIFVRCDS